MEQNNINQNVGIPNNTQNQVVNNQNMIKTNKSFVNEQPKIDFNSLDPIQKQQIIENAIRQANAKCMIEKPKSCKSLIIFCIIVVLLCIISVVILNNI